MAVKPFELSGEAMKNEPQEEEFVKIKEDKMHNLKLNQLEYGYCVEVACHMLAIESKETLIRVLTEYINDPSLTEKKFREGKLFVHQVAK